MQGKNISILRDLTVCQSVSEALTKQGLTFEYRILNLEIKEANRFISRMLKSSRGTPVLFLRKLRVIEGIPKSIESTYMVYEKVKGVEKEDLEHCSFYELIREKFGPRKAKKRFWSSHQALRNRNFCRQRIRSV